MVGALVRLSGWTASAAGIVAFAGFLTNIGLPRSVDRGPATPISTALAIDACLVGLFALPHSILARERFQACVGRPLYLLASGVALLAIVAFWQPMPKLLWEVESATGRTILHAVSAAGWIVLIVSTLELDPLDFAGVRPSATPSLRVVGLHRIVRHPTYAGWFLALWAAPTMTAGHALLAAGLSTYILVAIRFEERDLLRNHGAEYERYRRDVPMLVPRLRRTTSTS